MALSVTQLALLTQEEKLEYETTRMDYITIDGNDFTGYLKYSFFYSITYVKEPQRSVGGQIENLNSYARFLTPRLKISFAYMEIDTYRRLMDLIYAKAEHDILCYDPKTNTRVHHNFYFQPFDFPDLFQKSLKVLGIINYEIELTGTNTDLNVVNIVYHLNPSSSTGIVDSTFGSPDMSIGSDILIGKDCTFQNETFNNSWIFQSWNTAPDGTGVKYIDGEAYTVKNNMILYAQWRTNLEYTLSYNYGLGSTKLGVDNAPLNSKTITYNTALGELPTTAQIKVAYNNAEYDAYNFAGWFKTPQKASNSIALTAESLYDVSGNSTIYQIYEPRTFTIVFNSNGGTQLANTVQKYGSTIYSPTTTKSGFVFDGWWTTNDFAIGTQFIFSTMPPTDFTLYAKWVVG